MLTVTMSPSTSVKWKRPAGARRDSRRSTSSRCFLMTAAHPQFEERDFRRRIAPDQFYCTLQMNVRSSGQAEQAAHEAPHFRGETPAALDALKIRFQAPPP